MYSFSLCELRESDWYSSVSIGDGNDCSGRQWLHYPFCLEFKRVDVKSFYYSFFYGQTIYWVFSSSESHSVCLLILILEVCALLCRANRYLYYNLHYLFSLIWSISIYTLYKEIISRAEKLRVASGDWLFLVIYEDVCSERVLKMSRMLYFFRRTAGFSWSK